MASIYVNGQDKTRQISDWKIWWCTKREELRLTCYFPSGKSFHSPLGDCRVEPTDVVEGTLLSRRGSAVFSAVDRAVIYGKKHAVIHYRGSSKAYVMNAADLVFSPETDIKQGAVFSYFRDVAQARLASAAGQDKPMHENVLAQLGKLPALAHTALHAYCTGAQRARQPAHDCIYPFGVNQSQLKAVEQAFSAQVSVIEGPPGTGKTQTILNIIANIVLRGNNVAILSNNNPAVENVYEKLAKAGLDHMVARLGSKQNRTGFFDALPVGPAEAPAEAPAPAPSMDEVQAGLRQLKLLLHAQETEARLQAEIDELGIEQRYLRQWQHENVAVEPVPVEKYGLSPRQATDLMAYLSRLAGNRIRLKDRIELLFRFGIVRMKPFGDGERRKAMTYALQLHFYEKALQEKQLALASCRQALEQGSFKALQEALTAGSMARLKQHLHSHAGPDQAFTEQTYQGDFDAFVKRFPVIGSSTHSIVNSIAPGAILDYVIIDEASQQDLVPGILALGCARNLIVVGDRKQLPHIPAKLGIAAPAECYDCDKYSLLDSCLRAFREPVPATLLKEHYRCHPRIIQFCNQQFYGNQLLPMTRDSGEQPLKLVVTAKGNHTRRNANLRELDSLLETLKWDGESDWDQDVDKSSDRGFIAPYNAQVALSRTHLPADFVKETVHKFQGRECREIVFSTVLDKSRGSQRSLGFVDDPHLVNVAVSRAKDKFTLVTGDEVFAANNGHIAALVRHIEYYAEDSQIHRAPVVSAFDLLYKEYDQSLERLNARLNPGDSQFKSEQIVARILRDALAGGAHQAMHFHTQIALIQLVSPAGVALTAREIEFMDNRASCDFVLYLTVGKTPVGVIEVDGGTHSVAKQAERDALKDGILQKCGIPLLRLRTVESRIEERIAAFLAQLAGAAEAE